MSEFATGKVTVPALNETTPVWARIGVLSFGGPAAQIALMHKTIVEEKGWLEEKQFLNALNFCMLLPGPEAMQLATYAGWRMHGLAGGLIAGLLFVLPGALVIAVLASIYALYGSVPPVQALFLGVKAAVIVIVIEALIKVSRRALTTRDAYFIALAAFIAIFLLALPYPLIVIAAGAYGYIWFARKDDTADRSVPVNVSLKKSLRTIGIWLLVWWSPVFVLWTIGGEAILIEIAVFFSKLAVVTFGGAYAVLAYMAQDVVQANNWLSASEMVDGLGLAETTPGPLILVTQFVGFLAAEKQGGIWLGLAGAVVTLWVTFVPCFLWIFTGAPYIEWISAQPRLKGALSAITAAVVGVILNLSIWFALHVFFANLDPVLFGPFRFLVPDLSSLDWRVVVLSLLSAVLLLGLKWNILWVLMIAAFSGLAISLL